MSSKIEDAIKLAALMQTVPQEIYDVIYDFTFTTDAADIYITGGLRPPARLHVDSASRKLLARRYYRDTIFYFRESSSKPLIHWLQSLPVQHCKLLSHVRWDWQPARNDPLEYFAALMYLTEEADADFRGILRQRDCFYVKVWGPEGKEVWTNDPEELMNIWKASSKHQASSS